MDSLPTEILDLVLTSVCELDSDDFESDQAVVAAPKRLAPLLVCKGWRQAASASVYRTIILSTAVQARNLAITLSRSPGLGNNVRKLRLNGGFGGTPLKILQATPNVTHLCLCLGISSLDRTDGLCRSIGSIQPLSLRLIDFNNTYNNVQTRALVLAICHCIKEKWTKLVTVRFPYETDWPWKEKEENQSRLLEAMYNAPFLKFVYMPAPYNPQILLPLLNQPNLCAIYSETPFGLITGHHIRGETDQLPVQKLADCHKIHFPLPGPWAPSRRPYQPLESHSNNMSLMFRVLPPFSMSSSLSLQLG